MRLFYSLLRILVFCFVVRPITLILLGLNIRHRERLPKNGPAILIANHNSHLDTMVLMSLFPIRVFLKIRPVAAADYFLRNLLLSWFSLNLVRIIPVKRKKEGEGSQNDPLAPISDALARGNIVIFYPEGTRGEAERMTSFKSGIARLAERSPTVPIVPIFLHGLGKSLPKGEGILIPFFCDVFIGESLYWNGNKEEFLKKVEENLKTLANEGQFATWE